MISGTGMGFICGRTCSIYRCNEPSAIRLCSSSSGVAVKYTTCPLQAFAAIPCSTTSPRNGKASGSSKIKQDQTIKDTDIAVELMGRTNN